MPELPEVETICRGIRPYTQHKTIKKFIVRQPKLRWPIPDTLQKTLPGQVIQSVTRRAKYLLLQTDTGTLILHMGMSGCLHVITRQTPPGKHEHWDLVLENNVCLRYQDPRRFGAALWTDDNIDEHPLIKPLGPEPLSDDFNGDMLYKLSRNRRVAVKNFIMNGHVVVGVGNIYASESLFSAGIHPARRSDKISRGRYNKLAADIKNVLQSAIEQGGTTLRDFQQQDGKPGYFAQKLQVYGRSNQSCPICKQPIRNKIIGQRSSFYCANCQH